MLRGHVSTHVVQACLALGLLDAMRMSSSGR
jgi:hypothetical protein